MQCLSSMDTVQKIILLYQAGLKEEKKKEKKSPEENTHEVSVIKW